MVTAAATLRHRVEVGTTIVRAVSTTMMTVVAPRLATTMNTAGVAPARGTTMTMMAAGVADAAASEGHSEASREDWRRSDHEGSGWYGDPEGHSRASREGWRSSDHEGSGWYGDPEGHPRASREGWEDRSAAAVQAGVVMMTTIIGVARADAAFRQEVFSEDSTFKCRAVGLRGRRRPFPI
jgi:hypothetical protein